MAEDIHITPRSKRLRESELSLPLSPFEANKMIPRQRVSKKTLLPAVFATRIPVYPRAPLRTATNFSGSVVANDEMVMPRTVPERCTASGCGIREDITRKEERGEAEEELEDVEWHAAM